MECTLYLTDYCNFECSYCYEGNLKKPSFLTSEMLYQALNFIVRNNLDDYITLTFLGGEPLLNKERIYEAVKYIQKRFPKEKFKYKITTNGVFLDENIIQFMKENKFTISLSLDGDKFTHNLNRREKNDKDVYEIIINNCKRLLSVEPNAIVRMTLTPNNIKYLCRNVNYLLELGIKRIYTGINELAFWRDDDIKVFDNQLSNLDEIYLEKIASTEDKVLNLYDFKLGTFLVERKAKYCSAGSRTHIIINSKGKIYPCSFVANNEIWNLGDVFSEIDQRKLYETTKTHVINTSKCRDCSIAFSCPGGKCGFLNFMQTGYLNVPGEQMCNLWKMISKHNIHILRQLYILKNPRLMNLCTYVDSNNIEYSAVFKEIMRDID